MINEEHTKLMNEMKNLESKMLFNPMEIKEEVNIKKSGNGYLIEITDQFTENSLPITRLELEKIILYGQKILNENPDPIKTEPHIHPGDTSECFCKNKNPK